MTVYFAPREEQLERASKGLAINVDRLQEDVQRLKDWMQAQPHLPDPVDEDGFLYENMLVRCKGSVEVTKQALDFYCSQRAPVPELFADRDPCGETLTKAGVFWKSTLIKDMTPEGYRIAVYKFEQKDDLNEFSAEELMKWWIMDADVRLAKEVNLGEILIIDYEYLRMGHVIKMTAPVLHKGVVCGLNGFKAHMKGIHVINAPPAAGMLLTIIRNVLPKKLKPRFHVHPNLESLHKHVSRTLLPKTHGGDLPNFEELADEWTEELKSHREWILAKDQRCLTDEAKRPGKRFNVDEIFGIEGTFRQLAVD